MPKTLEINLEDENAVCYIGSALSSPARIQILKLLYHNSYNVGELAEKLQIPSSSAALYVRSLEQAGLINTTMQPGSRGSMKICSRKYDDLLIKMTVDDPTVNRVKSISMPIGYYTDCCVSPTCGLAGESAPIGQDDQPNTFFLPERVNAQILWSAKGYVEYRFPYQLPDNSKPKHLMLSFECCSETANYNEKWISDISIWINDIKCATWRCPSDFGARRGKLNPDWWASGSTQYGKLVSLEISDYETVLNSKYASPVTLNSFHFSSDIPISIKIGNADDAEYKGGFNLFGEKFGDYPQNIILSFVY